MTTAMPPFSKSKTTLCFLHDKDNILLAMKKRGFGMGKWNGTGGKVEKGESIEDATIREAKEEIDVTPVRLERVATLFFHFSEEVEKLGKTEETAVYFCREWKGKPRETEEMRPKWFSKHTLPFPDMWEDDIHWLPLVLKGEKVKGEFWFDEKFRLIRHEITKSEGATESGI